METLVQCRSCGEDTNRADWEARWRPCAGGWNWSWSGDQSQPMRSVLGVLAALAGAGCTGVSLGCAWWVPELSILSAVAAAFWWQVAKMA